MNDPVCARALYYANGKVTVAMVTELSGIKLHILFLANIRS